MSRSSRTRLGFTLLELILVLSVGSMITLLSFQGLHRQTESTQAQTAGQQLKIVGTAVNNYISARYGPISQLINAPGNTSDPGPRTCNASTSSCTITVATLVNEGLLPSNYSNNNSFSSSGGNAYTIVLKVTGTAPNWMVNGLVMTVPWTTGGVVRYDLLGQAMAAAGPDSGMTRASSSQIDGYNGIWNEAASTYSNITQLGQLGFRAGYGSALYSIYLRRDGTLPMTGDLNMSDGTPHNIAGAGNISGNGRLTMNQVYSSYVNLAGNLDMSGTATINGSANISGNASVSGTVYTNGFTDYGNASIGGTVYTSGLTDYGSATINGNANVGGTATAGRLVVPAGNTIQAGSIYYYGDGSNAAIRVSGSLYIQNLNGSAPMDIAEVNNLYATGNLHGNYLFPNGAASLGGGCGGMNGSIGTDGSQTLFCKSGVWTSGGGSGGQYVLRKYYPSGTFISCAPNPKTGGCWCPGGTSDVGYMTGQSYDYSPWDSYWETHFCMN